MGNWLFAGSVGTLHDVSVHCRSDAVVFRAYCGDSDTPRHRLDVAPIEGSRRLSAAPEVESNGSCQPGVEGILGIVTHSVRYSSHR